MVRVVNKELTIHIPPFPMPQKAKYGSPCNGCGLCCHNEVCKIGLAFFPEAKAPCPAIVYEGGKVRCGVVQMEGELIERGEIPYKDSFADMLGIGKGCCADDPSEYSVDKKG